MQTNIPTCSLLISTYNWPEALYLCFKSVREQSMLPNEIVICDDGSKKETALLVEELKLSIAVPVVHVWQKDEGFQLAKIRNKGIAAAKFDYIIQIDGDLILHKHFIKDHINFAKKGFFTTGSRVLLSPETTEQLIAKATTDVKKHSANDRNYLNGLHIPLLHNFFAKRYKNKGRHLYYVKGCNMAFWKKNLVQVNGYNEDFTGWGREDSELAIRLINSGVGKRFLKFGGISYHIFHKEASREMESGNIKMMQFAIEHKTTRVSNGMDQYL